MNLPRFSVHRPIFITMATLIVMVLGAVSMWRLPIDLLPEIELPSLTISTTYENASPQEVEQLVTQVIEQTVAAVPGVEEITSSSAEGLSNVTIRLAWGTDIDVAANDVRDRLDRVISDLPDDIDRPQLRRFDPSSFPVVMIGVASHLDPIELTQIIDNQIQYRLERVPGVAVADVFGEFEREIRVDLDPDRLKALAIPLETIRDAIREANVNRPAGEIEIGNLETTLRVPGELATVEDLANVIVAVREGAPVRLRQIARIDDTHRKLTRIVRINGERGVRIGVRKQSGANTVRVVELVLEETARLQQDLPHVRLVPFFNSADFIKRSIDNVAQSIYYGGSLALLILLLFLRNIRSTLVIAVAIPVSVIATFALIHFAGFTLNLMTLGGLALGVGMMVDNSIVVLENIYRYREEQGRESEPAAVQGAGEVTGAIIASTVTTLVIFLPLIFVEGTTGVLFRQLGLVIAFSLICSLMVALSAVPMLSSKLLLTEHQLRSRRARPIQWLADATLRAFTTLEDGYRNLVRHAVRSPVLTILIAFAALGASLPLRHYIGSEFMPPTDEGEVRVDGEMEVGTRLDILDRQMLKVEQIVEDMVPEKLAVVSSVGPSTFRPDASATGEVRISLTPIRQRDRSNEQIAAEIRSRLEGVVPGMTIRVRAPQGNRLLNRVLGGDEDLEIEVRGFDFQTLDLLARQVRDLVADVPGVTDVRVSREAGVPQRLFRIDRDKAADLGLTVEAITQTLETAVAGSVTSQFREGGDEHRILVRLADAERRSLDEILDLFITNTRDEPVLLRNVVEIESALGPTLIDRKDQQRIATVSANVAGSDMGTVARAINQRLGQIAKPSDYDVVITGAYEQQQEAFVELMISLGLSLVLVYMVMACLYESLVDPLVVMFSVPMAAIGVLLALFLTGSTFNAQSLIGCVMLGGIVVNNAILLVDQAGRLWKHEGMKLRDAVAEAGRVRLRPILMTTLTTILGLLPLALGIGEGAEAQAPLARAVVGGLAASTLITLVLIPAVYILFHRSQETA